MGQDSDQTHAAHGGFSSAFFDIVVAGVEALIVIGALTAASVYKGLALSWPPPENWKPVVAICAAVAFVAILGAAVFYLARRRIVIALLQLVPAVAVLLIVARIWT